MLKQMKKITTPLLMLAVALLIVAGCSKDKKIEKQLKGNWTISNVTTVTTMNNGTPTTDTDTGETSATFNKDGSGTSSSSGSGTNPFPDSFTWSVGDEKMTVIDTDTGTITIYDVTENSKDKIVVSRTYSETISGDDFTYTVTITLDTKE